MIKQRLVSFFNKEDAEECAEENNTRAIPRLACIEGRFYEWYDVWIEFDKTECKEVNDGRTIQHNTRTKTNRGYSRYR